MKNTISVLLVLVASVTASALPVCSIDLRSNGLATYYQLTKDDKVIAWGYQQAYTQLLVRQKDLVERGECTDTVSIGREPEISVWPGTDKNKKQNYEVKSRQ